MNIRSIVLDLNLSGCNLFFKQADVCELGWPKLKAFQVETIVAKLKRVELLERQPFKFATQINLS